MKHVLELPWGAEELCNKYSLKTVKGGFQVYDGVLLPRELRPFRSENFSLARWKEDEENAHVYVPDCNTTKIERKEQYNHIAEAVVNNYDKKILAVSKYNTNDTRLGVLYGITDLAQEHPEEDTKEKINKLRLLIVTPKSFIPLWQSLIESVPLVTAFFRPLIVHYKQITKLLTAPPEARLSQKASTKSKVTARRGVNSIGWDYVIYDQPWMLEGYPNNDLAQAACSISGFNKKEADSKPYSIFLGVQWDKITDYALLSSAANVMPPSWISWLQKRKFQIVSSGSTVFWLGNPPKRGKNSNIVTPDEATIIRHKDNRKLQQWLNKQNNFITATMENNIHAFPIILQDFSTVHYQDLWKDYRNWLNNYAGNASNSEKIRQRVNFERRVEKIKMPHIVQMVKDYNSDGHKVIIITDNNLQPINNYQDELYSNKIIAGTLRDNDPRRDEVVEDFNCNVYNVLITSDITQLQNRIDETDLIIINTSFKNIAERFESEKKTRNTILVPYIKNTFDEEIVEKALTEGENITEQYLSKLYRICAAKSLPPNRLS